MLERGPVGMQGAVLSILHCLLHYVDFNVSANAQQVNADLLRVIAKYIEVGPPLPPYFLFQIFTFEWFFQFNFQWVGLIAYLLFTSI